MLLTLAEILKLADERGIAVGSFNVPTLESVNAVIQAAEELQVPVIVQHGQGHEKFIKQADIALILLDRAKKASVPVCVQLDHGRTFDYCVQAIRNGFTSVMFDGSQLPYEENLRLTKSIVQIAHAAGVSVEAELGRMFNSNVGNTESKTSLMAENVERPEDLYTDPDGAAEFVKETGLDALAIAFGTMHGIYPTEPVLDLPRIANIRDKVDVPLVMHGGSGVSDEDYRTAIKNGIRKINYYTYMAKAGGEAIAAKVQAGEKLLFHDLSVVATEAMKEDVKRAMKLFAGIE